MMSRFYELSLIIEIATLPLRRTDLFTNLFKFIVPSVK